MTTKFAAGLLGAALVAASSLLVAAPAEARTAVTRVAPVSSSATAPAVPAVTVARSPVRGPSRR
jgi:hypothetical protein